MRHPFEHRADDFLIEVLDGLNFFPHIAHVARFVRGFDMNEYKIIFFQRAHSVLAFSFVIGIQETGDPWNVNALQASVSPQSMNDVYGGYNAAFDTEALGQR